MKRLIAMAAACARVDVPEGPSTGVEYYREGWASPSAVEAVAAGLSRRKESGG